MLADVAGYAAEIDRRTPQERDRYIDLLRAVAITAVVVGHWLAVAVFPDNGSIDGTSILAIDEWTHWPTWAFQVMPIFFLVGGYANATSWQRHRDAGGRWPAWVHRRSVRLLRPTAVFVGAGVAAVVAARLVGVAPAMVDRAAWAAGIMLWFLAVYVAVAAATPLTYRLHERYGIGATLTLGAVVAVADLARVLTGEPLWATPSFVLGWALVHQVGYWWRDGALPSRPPQALLVLAAGAAALVVLTVLGPWPVAMVDVPGAAIQNSSPPSVALLALATAQVGLALTVAGPVRAWLRRPMAWMVVASLNRVVLTLFLWHMTAAVVGAALLHGTGLLAWQEPLSAGWWAWRPVWLVTLTVIAAGLVAAFAPLEWRAGRAVEVRRERPGVAAVLAAGGIVVACGGLAQLTLGGLAGDGPLGLPVVGGAALAAGLLATHLAGRYEPQPAPA